MSLPDTMLAAVMPRAREIEMRVVPLPALDPGDVLIRVSACGICGTDLHLFHGDSRGVQYPLIAGHEIAGVVVAAGPQAAEARLGAPVVAEGRAGTGFRRAGGYAEYVSVPQEMLHYLAPDTDMVEAALIDPLACAIHAVNQAQLAPTDKVVVIGQGSSGMCMLQAARAMVGCDVGAVDNHDENLALSKRFGASFTANPKSEDAAAAVKAWTGGKGADCVMEATGREGAVNLALQAVRRDGRIVIYGVFGQPITMNIDTLMYGQVRMVGAVGSSPETYNKAVELLGRRQVELRPIVGRVMPLSRLPEALRLLEERQVYKVVIVPDALL
jgi:2-desacetyl-2-hydroxyethyl bacteriochlorophyllide A dehydrogenase